MTLVRATLAVRFAAVALAFYNVGAHDWRGVVGTAATWAAVEIGLAFHRSNVRQRDARIRRRLARMS